MPELPDVEIYVEALSERLVGEVLESVRVRSPSLVKSFDPPLREAFGKRVTGVERIGKRIVLALEDDLFLVFHLMIAGRFKWRKAGTKIPAKRTHAALDFADGCVMLTEASTRKRASLHVVRGREALRQFERGGLDVFAADADAFAEAIRRENRTLKRALTDPRILDGIGNAYSDEILHRARLSPVQLTSRLSDDDVECLFHACRVTLREWTDRLRTQLGGKFPEKVTAFRPEMAVHGKFGEPCPDCGAKVQRIVYADRETNYCARCQTGGKLLADRALSRLLKADWPRTLEEMETPRQDGEPNNRTG